MNKWYSILEQRIQNNEFKSIDEISKDFITLEEKLNDTFQNYNGKSELFNEFKTRVFAFAGNYFSKQAEREKKFIEEQNEQKLKKLKSELDTIKTNYNKENEKKQIMLSQNQTQINDLQEELNQTKESLALTQKEKEIESMNYSNQINRLKDDYERRLHDAEVKTNDNEEKSKEAERKVIKIKAEYDKQKALLSQKVDHLTKQLEDFSKREKEMKQETNSQIKEQSIAFKDKVEKQELKQNKNLKSERMNRAMDRIKRKNQSKVEAELAKSESLQTIMKIHSKGRSETVRYAKSGKIMDIAKKLEMQMGKGDSENSNKIIENKDENSNIFEIVSAQPIIKKKKKNKIIFNYED